MANSMLTRALRAAFEKQPSEAAKPGDALKDVVWSYGSMYSGVNFPKYNPDDLMGRKGYKIYQRMMTDEQVKAVVRFKRDAITSRDFVFKCEYAELTEEECRARIEIMEEAVCRMEGSFVDACNSIMSAMYMGFSMVEKVLQLNTIKGKQWYGIKHLRLKPGDTFYFYMNEFGDIIKLTQRMYGDEQELDLSKFIHYVQNPEWDQQYGRSELRECYRDYFSKDLITKFRNIYLERFAGGFAWAQPQNGKNLVPGSAEYSNLQSVLQNINTLTSAILPQNVGLNIEHPATTDAFEKALAACDKGIAKALLVPNLLGISEQGSHGSLAQADSQLEAFLWTLQADTARLEDCLNEQLMQQIGELNWGDGRYPRLEFNPISDKNKMMLINTWAALVTAGAVQASDTDEAMLRTLLNMPDKGTPITAKPVSDRTGIDPRTGLPVVPEPKIPQPKQPPTEPPLPGQGVKESADETIVGQKWAKVSAFLRAVFYSPDQPRNELGQWEDGGGTNALNSLVLHSGRLSDRVLAGNGNDIIAKQHAEQIVAAHAAMNPAKLQPEIRALHTDALTLAHHAQNGTAQSDAAAQHALRVGTQASNIALDKAMTMFERKEFAFDPSQARDAHGMWTMVGGGDVNVFAYHGTSDKMIAGQTHLKPGVGGHVNATLEQAVAEKYAHATALIKGGNPVVVRVNAAGMVNPNPQSQPNGGLRLSGESVPIHSVKAIPMVAVYEAKHKHGGPLTASAQAFAKAQARVAFAVIDRQSTSLTKDASDAVAGVLTAAVKRMVDGVPDMALADVTTVKFTVAELAQLKAAVLAGLTSAYSLGTDHARKEIAKAHMSRKFDSLQTNAADYLAAKAFTITGNLSGQVVTQVQNVLVSGIRDGRSAADMAREIYRVLESSGLTTEAAVQQALGTVSVEDTQARVSTIIRTASFDAINQARNDFFSSPELAGFVQALEYSAILDNVTTEICQELDGDTYAVDDPLWATYTPPNHFNCRSLLIPVTKNDNWEPSDPPTVEPQKGFGFTRGEA
jgi:SPP1 gp7 family putative phage head morphogenesis protein